MGTKARAHIYESKPGKDETEDKIVCFNHSKELANMRCHEKVDFFLHRPIVEYLVIFLIIADAILVTASLLLEIKIIEQSAKDAVTATTTTTAAAASGATTPHSAGHSSLDVAAEALHISSLVILTLFLIEIFLKLYGQREKFFKRKLQVVDSFIVAISFGLDIAVLIINDIDSSIINGLGLIIILRLWRFVRIVNGAVVATKEKLSEEMHEVKRHNAELTERNAELELAIENKEKEIDFLKGRLARYEPIDMVPTGSTRLPAYLPETREFPKQVLGDVTDDEDYRVQGFADVHHATGKPRVTLSTAGTAFQAYQPGATYQPTSQYPTEQLHRSPNAVGSSVRPGSGGETGGGYRGTEEPGVDTADESDVVSIKPAKYRSGNTFTVKKDGVPMTSL